MRMKMMRKESGRNWELQENRCGGQGTVSGCLSFEVRGIELDLEILMGKR
jgi:hypothetical protein